MRHTLARVSALLTSHPFIIYVLLAAIYLAAYLSNDALPGSNPVHPEGWWGWWDQSKYLESARALSRLDFAESRHWYPLGYALLGAPFVPVLPQHPFLVVNIACFLGTYWALSGLARSLAIHEFVHPVVPFLALLFTSTHILHQFIYPWNSTPVIFCLLAVLHIATRQEPISLFTTHLISTLAFVAIACRPTDALLFAVAALYVAIRVWRAGDWLNTLTIYSVAIATFIGYAALYMWIHASIYGLSLSPYMTMSTRIGFSDYHLGYKVYSILIDPRPYYGEGSGIFRKIPWLLLAIPGCVKLFIGRPAQTAVLLAVSAVNLIFYVGYTDLLPHGLWRYANIHYFLPFLLLFSLFATHAMGELIKSRTFLMISVVSMAVLTAVPLRSRLIDTEVATVVDRTTLQLNCSKCASVDAIVVRGTKLNYSEIYFQRNILEQRGLVLENITHMRTIPVNGEIQLIPFQNLEDGSLFLRFESGEFSLDSAPVHVQHYSVRFVLDPLRGWRRLWS